jgi:iron complex outermembrane receptor protein
MFLRGSSLPAAVLLALGATYPMMSQAALDDASAPAEAEASAVVETITVTSRNSVESVQDVPIPESVLKSSELVRDYTVNIQDLTQKAPGLEATTPNSRRTGISLRGIGKSAGNDALEASVGVLVDGIYLSHPGMTYQDFTDLDRVEVLRGPQGTLLGKNTTIGAISFVNKEPTFTPEASASVIAGERNTHAFNAAFSDSLIDNLLAVRVSGFVDKADGFITNVNAEGGTTNERNRQGSRLQFLLTPFDGFTARVNADYAETNERSNTKPVIAVLSSYDNAAHTPRVTTPGGTAVPTTPAGVALQNTGTNTYVSIFNRAYFGGYSPIVGSWNTEDLNLNVPVVTRNEGISSILDWRHGDLDVTLISGYRTYHFDAKNDADQTKFDTGRTGTLLDASQQSQELRLNQKISPVLDYQAGLYYLHAWNRSTGRNLYGADSGAYSSKNGDYDELYGSAVGNQLLQASLNRVYVTNAIAPDTKSVAAFGQFNWRFTDRATLTAGLRETYEDKTNISSKAAAFIDGTPLNSLAVLGASLGATPLQIASANDIRTTTVGTLFPAVSGQAIHASALSWTLSPSYKLNEHVMLYASAAAGQKSGSVQFTSTGTPANVAPEKVLDYELGVKGTFFEQTLLLDMNAFQSRVRNYQQTTSVYDAATTALRNDGTLYYLSQLGNIPEIMARGVEVEGTYVFTHQFSMNLGAVYNHAVYQNWHDATCPNELDVKVSTTVCDNTGRQIVAAPRFSSTATADFRQPVMRGFELHLWVSNVYRSSQNFDPNLSRYGIQPAYALTDVGAGIVTPNQRVEVDFLGRNVLKKRYTTSVNVGSDGSIGYDGIGDPSWFGAAIHIKWQ